MNTLFLDTAIETACLAGELLLKHFGRVSEFSRKTDQSNIVTEADHAAEKLIIEQLRSRFPKHAVIAEESGHISQESEYTWIIDPLDGTSNFVAGIPWFGVLIALCRYSSPIIGVMRLPVQKDTYVATLDAGASKNNQSISISQQESLADSLWAYGMDADTTASERQQQINLLGDMVAAVRNIRCTNSLIDACLTAEGRLGGFINHSVKVWDIAASALITQEAGGLCADVYGNPLQFDLSPRGYDQTYSIMAGAPQQFTQILTLAHRYYH
jgi:myo-inositol-1(or 4)-monophosphatase